MMLKEGTRQRIVGRLAGAIDEVLQQHYRVRTAEDRVTAKIGTRVEMLDGEEVDDYRFRIIAHDVPSSGSRPWETYLGADLYLAVSLDGPDGWDKGLLIQAKYDQNRDTAALRDQCKKMRSFTSASYVWVYGSKGLTAISAGVYADNPTATVRNAAGRSAAGFFGRILDCNAGSKKFGIPLIDDRRGALMRRLEDLAGPPALVVGLEHLPTRKRRRHS